MNAILARIGGTNRLRTKRTALTLIANRGWSPDIIIDVGAGLGTPGLFDVWPHVPAILIEPDPVSAHLLKQNGRPGDHLIEARASSRSGSGAIAIDEVLQEAPEARRVLLKIDVDGVETDVLAGAELTLRNCDCLVVIECVLHDQEQGRMLDICSFMRARGYELFDIIEPVYRLNDAVLWQVDCIFVSAESPLRGDRAYLTSRTDT